jgi:hypothetical protein
MFAFGGHIYRGQINASGDRRLAIADTSAEEAIRESAFLGSGAIDEAAWRLAPSCAPAVSVKHYDKYATAPHRSQASVFASSAVTFGSTSTPLMTIRDRLDKRQRAFSSTRCTG